MYGVQPLAETVVSRARATTVIIRMTHSIRKAAVTLFILMPNAMIVKYCGVPYANAFLLFR
ncbi:hypothetical protein AUEXF2481DRAFT_626379 [Aureobasidium subglaciale EXF-2481]|uniref:Uncharacterized protein n=1 Tax=Aureobasidium subglaciale (strain EXF-2481) TaxID=1043005 RepID=A0A074YSB3_AURSE|nr:uncharacterized protein AUEXF2481DRAFT_626379 [Aureobasidium subglaciale EXF-2481]KEQ97007.1 hypothetical protein AUEXF2481DRAFT_626379 [Aureobasidium subglaciale EXF-2481]